MESISQKTIGNIVLSNINTAKIFEKYDIDFGFMGDIDFLNACKSKNLDPLVIAKEIEDTDNNRFYLKDYNSWSLAFLIDFLVDIQHTKKKEDLEILEGVVQNIKNENLDNKEIKSLIKKITSLIKEILIKMNDEEITLFPHLKSLIKRENGENSNKLSSSFLLKNIEKIERERFMVGANLQNIIQELNNYIKLNQTKENVIFLLKQLKKFYNFVQEHNHIEKNILLPKALLLEAELLKK